MPHTTGRPSSPAARRRVLGLALAAGMLTVLAPHRASAQTPGELRFGPRAPELRVDALLARRQTYQAGLGVLWPAGRSLRVGLIGGGGVTDPGGGHDGARISSRAEAVAHFIVRASPSGRPRLYAGAGAGALWISGDRGRALVHALVGIEGRGSGWEHAVEVGLGGGVRLGLVLRRAR